MPTLVSTLKRRIGKTLKARRDARAWPAQVSFFAEEYASARTQYTNTEGTTALPTPLSKPAELGVHVLIPGGATDATFYLPEGHLDRVNAFSAETSRLFALSSEVLLDSADEHARERLAKESTQHQYVVDMPMVKEGKVSKLFLKNITDTDLLLPLVVPLAEQMEKKCYHSHVWFEKTAVYRSTVNIYPDKKSTLWHTDNHFESISKIMIYLTDVGKDNAPFEFLRHKTTGTCPRVVAHMPPHFPGSRVPLSEIARYEHEGYERVQVLGPKGTVIFFDDKVIHKGNEPAAGCRDALVVQLRPTADTAHQYVRPETTPV